MVSYGWRERAKPLKDRAGTGIVVWSPEHPRTSKTDQMELKTDRLTVTFLPASSERADVVTNYRVGPVETEGFARKRCARSVYTFTAAAKRHVAAWGIAPDALASTRACSACDSMLGTPADGRQNSVEHRGAAWSLPAAGGELLSAGTAE